MTVLTQSGMMMYASAAGFPNPPLMAAIGEAESSGRTDAVNSIGCVGIWQINQPVWSKTYPQWTVSWLEDPMNNATAAKVVYDAQGLGAWQSYTSGAYQKYYSGGTTGAATATNAGFSINPLVPGFIDPTGSLPGDVGSLGSLDSLGSISSELGKAGAWLGNPHNWLRVAYVAVGGLVLLVGIAGILRPITQPLAKTAVKTAAAVTPTGRVATVAGKAVKAGKAGK